MENENIKLGSIFLNTVKEHHLFDTYKSVYITLEKKFSKSWRDFDTEFRDVYNRSCAFDFYYFKFIQYVISVFIKVEDSFGEEFGLEPWPPDMLKNESTYLKYIKRRTNEMKFIIIENLDDGKNFMRKYVKNGSVVKNKIAVDLRRSLNDIENLFADSYHMLLYARHQKNIGNSFGTKHKDLRQDVVFEAWELLLDNSDLSMGQVARTLWKKHEKQRANLSKSRKAFEKLIENFGERYKLNSETTLKKLYYQQKDKIRVEV